MSGVTLRFERAAIIDSTTQWAFPCQEHEVIPSQKTFAWSGNASGLIRACLSFNIVADTEAVRTCDACPGSRVEAMCDFQVNDIRVSPLMRRVLAAADGLPGPLKAIDVENNV